MLIPSASDGIADDADDAAPPSTSCAFLIKPAIFAVEIWIGLAGVVKVVELRTA